MLVNEILEKYLKSEILPQIASPPYSKIEARQISNTRPVFRYREKRSHARIIGKYYQYGDIVLENAWQKAEKEYANLVFLRDQLGMKGDNYNIIAPLGRNKVLSALLVIENAPGETLDYYFARAIYAQETQKLFYKLSDLARFLVKLHRNGDTGRPLSPQQPQRYLDKVTRDLMNNLPGIEDQEREIRNLANTWWNRDSAFHDHEVIVHGDATPMNFLFYHQQVTGIDLEKMKRADRCWDLGFIAAELKHHFMWRTGDGQKAEPFIGHFLWEYAKTFGNTDMFYAVTGRLPLYMSLGLLRIARNGWLSGHYRRRLAEEARLCLKYK